MLAISPLTQVLLFENMLILRVGGNLFHFDFFVPYNNKIKQLLFGNSETLFKQTFSTR